MPPYTLYRNPQRPIHFNWSCASFPSGSGPHIQQPTEAKTVADSLVTGKYIFVLSVNDDLGNSASANFQVEVMKDTLKAVPPIIYPIPDVTINMPYNSVSLSASTSIYINPVGRPLFFKWTVIQQPAASDPPVISNSTSHTIKLSRLWSGTYLFELQLTNELGLSSKDTVEVKVIPDALSGTTRTYDDLPWIYTNDDEWGLNLYLNIDEPNTFADRNKDNTEVKVWDRPVRHGCNLMKYIGSHMLNGMLIYKIVYPFEPLIGTKTKVQIRFF